MKEKIIVKPQSILLAALFLMVFGGVWYGILFHNVQMGSHGYSVEDYANKSLDLGADGLTLHPRPDHRHATSDDVISIANLCKKRNVGKQSCRNYAPTLHL